MRLVESALEFSASDLSRFLGCHHRTGLDLAVAHGQRIRPTWIDPALQVLQERGLEHERQYVETLAAQGHTPMNLSEYEGLPAEQRTLEAMRAGAAVIVQAVLRQGHWYGRPDLLRRIESPSALGAWSYEPVDTKLALATHGGTLLQLLLYCDLLGEAQRRPPERFHVVTPDERNPVQSFRLGDYAAYFRLLRTQLENVSKGRPEDITEANYPEPVEHCEVCSWWQTCDHRRREDDHLSLVAGVTRLQSRELEAAGVRTLAQLGTLPLPLKFKPRRGAVESLVRAREQARIQLEGRSTRSPVHELLPIVADRGFTRLPEPSPGDVFLDLEGDPFVPGGGREYLFGMIIIQVNGALLPRSFWGLSPADECAAFEKIVAEIERSWAAHPGMHVYHYAPYEPAALKRLMGRYAKCEAAIDRLLRAERFVDLHSIVRQAVRASVESYSIKDLEPFYHFARQVPLVEARQGLRAVERAIELGMLDALDANATAAVEGYNREDCLSAQALRDWLERLRAALVASGESVPRPTLKEGTASEKVSARQQRVEALVTALTAGVPIDIEARTENQQASWLLAQLLDWHRREAKAPWWEFFRLRDLADDELLDEKAALSGLTFSARIGGTAKCPIDQYTYPHQETEVREGHDVYLPGADKPFGTVEAIDRVGRTVDIKKASTQADVNPAALFAQTMVRTQVLEDSLQRLADDVIAHGLENASHYRVARELLRSRSPRLSGSAVFAQSPAESAVEFAIRVVGELDDTVLAIQGPPGAGKTFTGANMICELVKQGARVGVTAASHKVITNLLETVLEIADKSGVAVECVRKVTEPSEVQGRIVEYKKNEDIDNLIDGSGQTVVGGTPFLWARLELHEKLDVLFVDEAGQMSLANVLAASQCARNVVLLGDPQQLEQPQQGSHPPGADLSALEHILKEHPTIPPDRGIFLPETWRLPPAICAFTSEVFYEGKLHSLPGLERRALRNAGPIGGAGLWVLPVAHEGNRNSSHEEVDAIELLTNRMLTGGADWIDRDGSIQALTPAHVLVVAPYNSQVALLTERLGPRGVRVGTVDKFQGQQAPIVIYSMATSAAEDAPRGMEFLYSLNRLNVATSRAQCACILVASPRLFAPECKTPRQMRLANALCRYVEIATPLPAIAVG
jgi:predicted RecB family nuclease